MIDCFVLGCEVRLGAPWYPCFSPGPGLYVSSWFDLGMLIFSLPL